MAVDPRRLAVLLAVHRAGGVVAAADLLRVTPSAVSQQIARLESEAGAVVLDRGPRGVTLTPAGRVLADAAERIETELVEAQKTMAALGDELTGTVVVGAFKTAIRAVVAPVAAYLARSLPGVELGVAEYDPVDAIRLLRAGDLDVILLEEDIQDGRSRESARGTRDVVLLDEPWRLVIPAGFPTPTRLADVADATWLGAHPDTAAARALDRVARDLGAALRTRHLYNDFDVALALVAAERGVAILPALAVAQHGGGLPDGVTVVPLPGLGSRRLVLRHRATRREPTPIVRAVVEAMVATANQIELG